jgi:kumamolisin
VECLLTQAHDLGPSRAASADVLVALRGSGRPTAVLRWAAQHGLHATWFPGQPTVLLMAPPAILGPALGVRIDDFRLAGRGVFYASTGNSNVPALLRREVTALGRISSFGQVHTEGIPVGGLAPI